MHDPYSVLGVPRDADVDSIRRAYRRLARTHHPDVNDAPEAETRFKEVGAAYAILSNPEKRRLFDRFGEAGLRAGGDPAQGSPHGQPFAGDFDDLLDSLFGGGRGHRGPMPGRDVKLRLTIGLLLAVTGGEAVAHVPQPRGRPEEVSIRVPAGVEDGARLRLPGRGHPPPAGGPCGDLIVEIRVAAHALLRRCGDDLELDLPITVLEALEGATVGAPTPTGDVRVGVPRGARNGQRLRLRGRGVQKPGSAGDLYLVLRVAAPDATDDPGVLAAARALEAAYRTPVRADLTL
jgi:curved DNA-binding protein